MALQSTSQNVFNAERARRYKTAIAQCPTARYLEVLPLLCLCANPDIQNWDVLDLGSGTGYLADFFEGNARYVLRVDRSLEMLQASGNPNIKVGDMSKASQVVGDFKADLITSLAAFHHNHIPDTPSSQRILIDPETRHWTQERHLNGPACQQLQYDAIRDWCQLLKPGGRIILIDVPGYPDLAWNPFYSKHKPQAIDSRGYHEAFLQQIADWVLHIDATTLARFFRTGSWQSFWRMDEHMKELQQVLSSPLTMKALIGTYRLPQDILKCQGAMVPADFFDDILDCYGTDRHFAYFPRESSIREAFTTAGMASVRTGTFPTPWLFKDEREAAWFVHELFGLGRAWELATIPTNELDQLIQWLEKYLGFYKDGYGRTLLYWQLGYFVAQKPSKKSN